MKLAKTGFLMAYQMPGLRQHTFNHDLGFMPISMQAGMHKICPGAGACTVAGNDLGDHGCKFIDTLHGNLVKTAARARCGQPAKWVYVPHPGRNARGPRLLGAQAQAPRLAGAGPGSRSSAPAGIRLANHRLRSPVPAQCRCRPGSPLFRQMRDWADRLGGRRGARWPRIQAAVVAGQRPGARHLKSRSAAKRRPHSLSVPHR
jgi:hypothetical protein